MDEKRKFAAAKSTFTQNFYFSTKKYEKNYTSSRLLLVYFLSSLYGILNIIGY